MPFFLLRRAANLAAALAEAKRMCRCIRKSFSGVRWMEGGEERRLTWAEVDGA